MSRRGCQIHRAVLFNVPCSLWATDIVHIGMEVMLGSSRKPETSWELPEKVYCHGIRSELKTSKLYAGKMSEYQATIAPIAPHSADGQQRRKLPEPHP